MCSGGAVGVNRVTGRFGRQLGCAGGVAFRCSYTGSAMWTAMQFSAIQFWSASHSSVQSQFFVVTIMGVRHKKTSYVYS